MNQSELEANTRKRQAREHACDQVTIGLSFGSDCLRERREFFNQLESEVKQNQSRPILLSTLN